MYLYCTVVFVPSRPFLNGWSSDGGGGVQRAEMQVSEKEIPWPVPVPHLTSPFGMYSEYSYA